MRLVAPLGPLQLVFIREIEDCLPEWTGLLHFFVYSFGDAIENELKRATNNFILSEIVENFYIYKKVY